MPSLTHRERVVKALNHEEPNRVPRDLGQGVAPGINTKAYANLIEYIALDEDVDNLKVDLRGITADPSEDVFRRFDIDFRRLSLGKPDVAPDR